MSELPMTEARLPLVPIEVSVREPFEALYQREFVGLVRLAMVLVDNQEQAEEVVQDAFAGLYLRYRLVSAPLAYVRASVLNGSRKVLRRRLLSRRYPNPPIDESELVYNHVLDAIRRLPPRQRAAVVLRYELQLTDVEIADTLKMPLGTVKSTMYRALARLRLEVTND
jgi:RNA polymerase sigma factor (sigma-70 family)